MPAAMIARPYRTRLLLPMCVALLTSLTGCRAGAASLPPGSVLFQDDFARRSSGWPSRRSEQAIVEYRDGRYAIHVLAPHTSLWSTPGLELGAVHLEVDVLDITGPEDNVFGLVCGYQDDENFLFLVASSDGFAGIGEYRHGERSMLSGEAMLPADPIAPSGADNHLAADCLPDGLRLYVNGSLVSEAALDSEPVGDVGLIAGTYAESGLQVVFDNFSVRVPELAAP